VRGNSAAVCQPCRPSIHPCPQLVGRGRGLGQLTTRRLNSQAPSVKKNTTVPPRPRNTQCIAETLDVEVFDLGAAERLDDDGGEFRRDVGA